MPSRELFLSAALLWLLTFQTKSKRTNTQTVAIAVPVVITVAVVVVVVVIPVDVVVVVLVASGFGRRLGGLVCVCVLASVFQWKMESRIFLSPSELNMPFRIVETS